MSEQECRLQRCFTSVFPTLNDEEEIRNVNAEALGIWDSLSTVTLVAVVQEEFDIEIPSEIVPKLTSFDAFHSYLQRLSRAEQSDDRQ